MARAEARVEATLGRLLAAEREALLAGRYERLDSLVRRKRVLIEALAAMEGGGQALVRAQPGLERNLRLVGAALEGLRAAREVLDRAAAPLRTYGPDGQAGPTGPGAERIVRRV